MTALGDVAAVVGVERMGFLSKALSDVRNKQVLYAQETRQFSDNGVNLYQMLAESMNLPIEKVRQMGESHKITYEMIEKALFDATQKGGMFYGQQAAQVNTVRGQLEKLKDTIFAGQVVLGNYFEGGIMKTIKGLDSLADAVFGSDKAIQRTADALIAGGVAFMTYQVATNAATTATTGLTLAQSISALGMRAYGFVTESISLLLGLNTTALTVNTVAVTASNTAMTAGAVSARTFWASLTGPVGLIVAIGATVAALFGLKAIMSDVSEEMNAEEKAVRSLHNEFKQGDGAVKDLTKEKETLEKRERALKDALLSGNASLGASTILSKQLSETQGTLVRVKGDLLNRFNQLKGAFPQYLKDVDNANVLVSNSAVLLEQENRQFEKKIMLIQQEKQVKRLVTQQNEILEKQESELIKLQKQFPKVWESSKGSVDMFVNSLQKLDKYTANQDRFFPRVTDGVLSSYQQYNSQLKNLDGQLFQAQQAQEKLNDANKSGVITYSDLTASVERGARTQKEVKKQEIEAFKDAEMQKILALNVSNE
jgi:tape measure domain-containing protein